MHHSSSSSFPFRPCDLSTSRPSRPRHAHPPFVSGRARALTQFCNFNLIFAHRYRPEQTAIMRADLIRQLRCLSENASAFIFSGHSVHFRKNPRARARFAPRLCKRSRARESAGIVAMRFSRDTPRPHLLPMFAVMRI